MSSVVKGIMSSEPEVINMINEYLTKAMNELKITQMELAEFLSVDPKTVNRWYNEVVETPGSARAAINAWLYLNRCGLSWRPDGLDYMSPEQINQQICLYRQHAFDLMDILNRAQTRRVSGHIPYIPWGIDLKTQTAKLELVWISFDRLSNGGFFPSRYWRRDGLFPDLKRDQLLIEDATLCYANAIKKVKE